MGTEDDRMLRGKSLQQIPHLNDLSRIHTYHRLIEDQNLRISDQSLSQSDPLLISLGKIADHPVCHLVKLDLFDHRIYVLVTILSRHLFELRHKHQILPDGHIRVERRDLRQIADTLFCLEGLSQNIIAVDLNRSTGGCCVTRHNIHRRRFARAVWPEESIYLSFFHGKRKPVYRRALPIFFYQIFYLDQ